MTLRSTKIQFAVLVFALTASFTTIAYSADPKVVRASHTQATKDEPAEVQSSKSDDVSKSEDMSYSPQWPEPPNTGAILMRLCVGTIVVLGVCVGTLWFGKPWLQKLKVAGSGNPSFYIEGSVAVGNRAMLYLVRVGGTQLVAGTDATGLKSLIAIPTSFKDVLDEQVPEIETENAPPSPVRRPSETVARTNLPLESGLEPVQRPFDARRFTGPTQRNEP